MPDTDIQQERRSADRPEPSCRHCETKRHMTVSLRTDSVIYFRCAKCGYVKSYHKANWNR